MPTSPRDQEELPGYDFEAEQKRERKRLAAMELPRQPQPVTVTIEGDPRDVEIYLAKIKAAVEHNSYDNAVRAGSILVIYPHAVND